MIPEVESDQPVAETVQFWQIKEGGRIRFVEKKFIEIFFCVSDILSVRFFSNKKIRTFELFSKRRAKKKVESCVLMKKKLFIIFCLREKKLFSKNCFVETEFVFLGNRVTKKKFC